MLSGGKMVQAAYAPHPPPASAAGGVGQSLLGAAGLEEPGAEM